MKKKEQNLVSNRNFVQKSFTSVVNGAAAWFVISSLSLSLSFFLTRSRFFEPSFICLLLHFLAISIDMLLYSVSELNWFHVD